MIAAQEEKNEVVNIWLDNEAVQKGKTETVKLLLANGADVNAVDKKGRTALMIAAQEGRTKMVKLLLANGADVNAANTFGKTALSIATRRGDGALVELLKANGATK